MGMNARTAEVTTITMRCDQCGKEETSTTEIESKLLGEEAAEPEALAGWLVFRHPRDLEHVAFHTQRCAIGFFRQVVRDAAAPHG